jgi:hypothetical protein
MFSPQNQYLAKFNLLNLVDLTNYKYLQRPPALTAGDRLGKFAIQASPDLLVGKQ